MSTQTTKINYNDFHEHVKKQVRDAFNSYMVEQGKCSSINGMEDDCTNGEYYIYKSQFEIWKGAVCSGLVLMFGNTDQ